MTSLLLAMTVVTSSHGAMAAVFLQSLSGSSMVNISSRLSLPLLISTQFCSTYHALASEVRYNLGLISWAWAACGPPKTA